MRTVTAFWNEHVRPCFRVKRGSTQWKAVVEEKNYSFANGKDYEIPGYYTKSGNPVTYMQR